MSKKNSKKPQTITITALTGPSLSSVPAQQEPQTTPAVTRRRKTPAGGMSLQPSHSSAPATSPANAPAIPPGGIGSEVLSSSETPSGAPALVATTPETQARVEDARPSGKKAFQKAEGGVPRSEVMEFIAAAKLRLTEKSSTHAWLDRPTGVRLVVPPRDVCNKLFVYGLPEATDLPGYRTPEQRKAERLGGVTHAADITDLEQVKALVAAVVGASK